MDETALVNAARRGDDQAFMQLMGLYKVRLYKMAYAYLHNEQDALEAIQETTVRAYTGIGKLSEPKYFGSWLVRILINYCIDERKRRQKTTWLADEAGTEEAGAKRKIYGKNTAAAAAAPDADTSALERRLLVEQALGQLEPKYRKVVFLKYFGDLTLPEIAAVLGCPEGTAKTWLHQGLKAMRGLLGEGGDNHVGA